MLAAPTAHYNAIIATPTDESYDIMDSRKERGREGRVWKSPEAHFIFRVFGLLDGERDHRKIGQILGRDEMFVRYAIIFLSDDGLVQMRVCRKELPPVEQPQTATLLLSESFALITQNFELFAYSFCYRFRATGQALYGTDEIEQLFADISTQQQHEELFRMLGCIVAGVEGSNKQVTGDLVALPKHHRCQVKPEHYRIAGDVLMATLQWFFSLESVELKWNQELYEAWLEAYTVVSSAMMDGGR